MGSSRSKWDGITSEVSDLHPILKALLPKLPRVREVEYRHGNGEMGADFVLVQDHDTFGTPEYVGVIAKIGNLGQDHGDVQRQIEECDVPRLFFGGKERVRLSEIWVMTTGHITSGAQTKIHERYKNRKVQFVDGSKLARLVDLHVPAAWSQIPLELGMHLHDIGLKAVSQDRTLSFLQLGDNAFYVKQELYSRRNIVYGTKAPAPKRIDPLDAVVMHRFVLIEGGAGYGKSKLVRQLVSELVTTANFTKHKLIPVMTTLVDLRSEFDFDLSRLIEKTVPALVREQAGDAEFLVVIDGFDEARIEADAQASVLERLSSQSHLDSKIRIVVASRYLRGIEEQYDLGEEVGRYEIKALSMDGVIAFIRKLCSHVSIEARIIEDLKKSPLFKTLPRSPIAAILLAKILAENVREVPSSMTELYSKYLEITLGRWDIEKGLQVQKQYQALDNVLMSIATQMLETERDVWTLEELRAAFNSYLGDRNLQLEAEELIGILLDRCEVMAFDEARSAVGFKHRTFAEYFCAKARVQDSSLVIDGRAFSGYWNNVFFFYFGIRKDSPGELSALCRLEPGAEGERWLQIISIPHYLLAAYATPTEVITEGIRRVSVAAAELFREVSKPGSESPFARLSKMHLLYLLQALMKGGCSYQFFLPSIEEAALQIDDSVIDPDTKALSLFFLNVAYVQIDRTKTFDFMLEKLGSQLPLEVALALRHEAVGHARGALVRKQERYVRRMLEANKPLQHFVTELYQRPIREVVAKEKGATTTNKKKSRRS